MTSGIDDILITNAGGTQNTKVTQSAKYASGGNSATITLTLVTAPKVGDILIAFTAYSQSGNVRTISGPAGWTKLDDLSNGNNSLATWYRVVQAGDGTSYAWTISGASNGYCSGVIIEATGVDQTNPIYNHGIATYGSNPALGAVISTNAVSPGNLVIAGATCANNVALSSMYDWAFNWLLYQMDQDATQTYGCHVGHLATGMPYFEPSYEAVFNFASAPGTCVLAGIALTPASGYYVGGNAGELMECEINSYSAELIDDVSVLYDVNGGMTGTVVTEEEWGVLK